MNGTTFIGIEGNGWTWALFAAAGLLLLLGSPVHWGAKSMAFIVGVAYVVGALIALSDGTDILGIFATNNWTKLVMGAGGAALIVLSMMPRVGRRAGTAPVGRARAPTRRGRFARGNGRVEREPVTTTGGTLDDDRQRLMTAAAAGAPAAPMSSGRPDRLSWRMADAHHPRRRRRHREVVACVDGARATVEVVNLLARAQLAARRARAARHDPQRG